MNPSTIPYFSIITVNLNNKNGLKSTIKSLINQSFRKFEFLVIDGLSTDGSTDIIKQYEPHISYWVSEKDNGIYHAMNKGIKQSRGKYCLFLNSADSLVNNEVLKSVYEKNRSEDILFGNLVVISEGKVIDRICGKHHPTFLDAFHNRIKHQATFIKKELFNTYGLYDENFRIASDWDFFLKSVGIGNATSFYLNMDIANYDNNGISNKKYTNDITLTEREEIINRYIPKRMQPDYEFLKSTYSYHQLFTNPVTLFIIKVINKIFSLFSKPGR